jgi:hypothetical protein
MRGRLSLLSAVLLCLISPIPGAAQEESPCSSPEAAQFDFWLGEWELASRMRTGPGEEDWQEGTASNRIEKTLDGCVILENFDGRPATELIGMSVSTWNSRLGKWQQTWVDNQGGYLDFVGRFKDGRMVLSRETVRDGKKILQRMVFDNITENSLDWAWQSSEDEGKSWKLLWHLHYTRKKDL